MKKLVFIILIYFIASQSLCYSGVLRDSIIDGDKLLSKIQNLLPAGWSFLNYENNALVIQREELVFVLYENRINAPVSRETREEIDKRIIENGKQWRSKYDIGFYPLMKNEEMESIRKHNDSIQEIINYLPEKYNVKHLLDKFSMSKGEEIYTGKTTEEKERIESFYTTKKELLNRFRRLPDYNSEKYSLYIDLIQGMEDQMHLIYPHSASEEMYKIREILDENLIKVK